MRTCNRSVAFLLNIYWPCSHVIYDEKMNCSIIVRNIAFNSLQIFEKIDIKTFKTQYQLESIQ